MATFKNTSLPSSAASSKRSSGGGNRLFRALFFLFALAAVAAASVGSTWMIMTRMQEQTDAERALHPVSPENAMAPVTMPEPPPPPAPIFYELAPFTVTVQDEFAERILHVGMTLRMADEVTRQHLESYLPEVRSRILLELAHLTPNDLKGSQSRGVLANAIINTLNRPFAPLPVGQYVTDVLFTSFVVQ